LFNVIPSLLESDSLLSKSTKDFAERKERKVIAKQSFCDSEDYLDIKDSPQTHWGNHFEMMREETKELKHEERKHEELIPNMQKPINVKPHRIHLS